MITLSLFPRASGLTFAERKRTLFLLLSYKGEKAIKQLVVGLG